MHVAATTGLQKATIRYTWNTFSFRIPSDSTESGAEKRQQWIAGTNRKGWQPGPGARLCSEHFIDGKFLI